MKPEKKSERAELKELRLEKNFQIVRMEPAQAKQLIEVMKELGDRDLKGVAGVQGAKGPSGTQCSSTKAGLEPIGRADFECEDSD